MLEAFNNRRREAPERSKIVEPDMWKGFATQGKNFATLIAAID